MSDYILSCCSTADLTKEHFESRDIHYICFHFEVDDKQYPDDLGVSFPFADFYKAMADGAMTRTSQVAVTPFCRVQVTVALPGDTAVTMPSARVTFATEGLSEE